MRPIDFEGTNLTLTKPDSMLDEECLPLRAFKGVDDAGFNFILTAWQPNKEDLEALKAGRPICIKVLGVSQPPMSIFTYDEQYKANE